MEQLNNLDVVFLVIVGVSALVAIARGVTKELLSIIGWVLAGVSVYYLLPVVDPIMKKYIASEVLSGLVSGMVIFLRNSLCKQGSYSKAESFGRKITDIRRCMFVIVPILALTIGL